MHFFHRKDTYFHGIYLLLDLKVMLCIDFHNWVDFQRSVANKNCLYKPFKGPVYQRDFISGTYYYRFITEVVLLLRDLCQLT